MITDRLLALAWAQFWQISLAIAVIGPIALWIGRRRPHWAYALWLLLLVKSITPPLWSSPTGVFSWLATERAIERVEQPAAPANPLPPIEATALSPPVARSSALPMPNFTAAAELPRTEAKPTDETFSTGAISVPVILLGVWAAGAIGMLSIVSILSLSMWRRITRGSIQPGPDVQRLFDELRSSVGAGRRVRLVVSRERFGPALIGLIRPRVVLPSAVVEGKSAGELAPILAHELVHLRRGDNPVAHVQLLAQALWWFQPLVWWMNRQLGRVREMSCDEEVLATLDCQPADYAQTLLDVVRLRRAEQKLRAMPLALSMQSAEFAAARLKHIMSDSLRFHRHTPRLAWAMIALAGLAILPGAGLLAQNGAAKPAEQPAATTTRSDDVSIAWTILDGETRKPLPGVHVAIRQSYSYVITDDSGRVNFMSDFQTADETTNAVGNVAVTVPAAALPGNSLEIVLRAERPGYAGISRIYRGGWSDSVSEQGQATKFRFGGPPLEMFPGEPITGTVEDPAGKPLAGFAVMFASATPDGPQAVSPNAALQAVLVPDEGAQTSSPAAPPSADNRVETWTFTDEHGRFECGIRNGWTAELSTESDDEPLVWRFLGAERGELGTIRFQRGIRASGRAATVSGEPLPGIWVRLLPVGADDKFADGATHLSRAARTADDGTFRLGPLQAGRYRAVVSTWERTSIDDPGDDPLPAAFDPLFVDLSAEGPERSIEIRAVKKTATGVDSNDNAAQRAPARQAGKPDPVSETIVRTVVDGDSGKPLAGVHVTVEHWISPATGSKLIATTKYVTDKDGNYKIEIPASELEHATLALQFAIDHPGYAPPPLIQYGVQYFRNTRQHGLPPGFDVDQIYPGDEVTGTIEDPTGKPVANLPVHAMSMRALDPQQSQQIAEAAKLAAESGTTGMFLSNPPITSQTVIRTDAKGRFRFNALKTGSAEFWVEPAGYAALSRSVGQKHGDVGKTVLGPGVRVKGQVLDADGKPVPSVWASVSPAGQQQPYGTDIDHTQRAAQTDAEGRFRTEPVHPGNYVAKIVAHDPATLSSWDDENLPAVFEPAKIEAPADQPETAVEIRAIPHYTIRAHFTDAAGKPFAGAHLTINARRNGKGYSKVAESNSQGLAEARVPRDLDHVRAGTMQGEPYSVYRWRDSNGLLRNHAEIELGHLDQDVDNLNFIHYRPPTLWLTTVDPAGKPIDKVAAKVDYLEPDGDFSPETAQTMVYPVGGNRWSTQGLLPDQQLLLTIDAEGRQPATFKFKLAEGESKELKVVLKPETDKP